VKVFSIRRPTIGHTHKETKKGYLFSICHSNARHPSRQNARSADEGHMDIPSALSRGVLRSDAPQRAHYGERWSTIN
jgi:hypothetical protein